MKTYSYFYMNLVYKKVLSIRSGQQLSILKRGLSYKQFVTSKHGPVILKKTWPNLVSGLVGLEIKQLKSEWKGKKTLGDIFLYIFLQWVKFIWMLKRINLSRDWAWFPSNFSNKLTLQMWKFTWQAMIINCNMFSNQMRSLFLSWTCTRSMQLILGHKNWGKGLIDLVKCQNHYVYLHDLKLTLTETIYLILRMFM